MKKKNQNINCDGTYNDKDNSKCNLDKIDVTADLNVNTEKQETICDSLKKDDNEKIEEEYKLGKDYYEETE